MRVPAFALVVAAVVSAGCGGGENSSPPPAATATAATTDTAAPLPAPVAETRAAILAASTYDDLRPLFDPKTFLSDFGFGNAPVDVIAGWRERGSKPLEQMDGLLALPHAVVETNEGTLYQWPRFDPDSRPNDLTPAERDAFLRFLTEAELAGSFNREYGYVGPRLGILADGRWWFFLSGGAA